MEGFLYCSSTDKASTYDAGLRAQGWGELLAPYSGTYEKANRNEKGKVKLAGKVLHEKTQGEAEWHLIKVSSIVCFWINFQILL